MLLDLTGNTSEWPAILLYNGQMIRQKSSVGYSYVSQKLRVVGSEIVSFNLFLEPIQGNLANVHLDAFASHRVRVECTLQTTFGLCLLRVDRQSIVGFQENILGMLGKNVLGLAE